MVLRIRVGSVEDIPPCQMVLFCVKCVLQDTGGAVNTQPSSTFATAMDFTYISCHLPFRIIIIIIIIIIVIVIVFVIIIVIIIIIIVTFATALAMGLNCQQPPLQV